MLAEEQQRQRGDVMGGYQFLHVECYSRSAGAGKAGGRTLRDVVAEAEREPSACPHITLRRLPVLLRGAMPSAAAALAEERAAGAKDGAGRKFRKDGLCMLGGVASYPENWDLVEADAEAESRWAAWETATVAWLQGEYGSRLASVVRHEDENHPHLHFYVVPELGDGDQLRIATVHDGRRAAEAAKAAGAAKGEQNQAYKVAMRGYQSRYWQSVSLPHGLTRLGPGKRRLTRAAWQAEKVAATSAAEMLRTTDHAAAAATDREARAVAAVERARAMVANAKSEVMEAKAVAEAAEVARRKAETDARAKARAILARANGEGRRLLAEAEAKAAPLRRLGGLLGALWSGFLGVKARLVAAADAKVAAAKRAAVAEVAKAKEVLRAEAREAVDNELIELRRLAERAACEQADAEARAGKAVADVRTKAEELRQLKTTLTAERMARRSAEVERERFRNLWADADNALIAMRRPASGPGLRQK